MNLADVQDTYILSKFLCSDVGAEHGPDHSTGQQGLATDSFFCWHSCACSHVWISFVVGYKYLVQT